MPSLRQIFNPKARKGIKQSHLLLLQNVEEWHSVICAITSNKENVTVAAEISMGHTKQVLEIQMLQLTCIVQSLEDLSSKKGW